MHMSNYTFVKKPLENAGAKYTRVVFTKETTSSFCEKDAVRELRIGVGSFEKMTRRRYQILCRKAIQTAKQQKLELLAIELTGPLFTVLKSKGLAGEALYSFTAQNFELANFEFKKYKTAASKIYGGIKEVAICGTPTNNERAGFKRGLTIAESVNNARVLSNTPGGDMTPKMLARAAKDAVKGTSVSCKILGKKEMEKLGMGAVLGVARGSEEEPQFIILEHRGGKKEERPIVFIGKGVTFDTGGLNVKPGDSMNDMHLDMSGGAAVIHAVALAGHLKVKKNIIGLIPAVENMPSGASYRPGDILTSLSGKTIEVLNTDAEGRVILADALTYAMRYKPRAVIDVATLTGAVLIALGEHAHGVLSRDEDFSRAICSLGEEIGEYAWPLPLWDEYEQYMPGNFGDVANIPATGNSRYAGVINGGMFLYQFTKEYPKDVRWAHIDMASRMTAAPGDQLTKGSTGEPVRLLFKIAETL